MKAYVVSKPGGPEVLELKEVPDPQPELGQALIGIKAFGLNRAEAVTRMGGSGKHVVFPKVIGIECVGTILACPGGELSVGQTVAAAMGGMGRKYDGSYAEKTVVPVTNIFPLQTTLDWVTLGSIPETYFTAWGCCFDSLKISGEKPKILIRPGASALGIAVVQIINVMGGEVIGVTRSAHKVERLLKAGMKHVIVSEEAVAEDILDIWPNGANGVIDTIVSKVSVKDDLRMLAKRGRLCVAGSLADSYETEKPANDLTLFARPNVGFYSSETLTAEKNGPILQNIVHRFEKGDYQPHIDAVYDFDDLPTTHEKMDNNGFCGKVVVKL
ncbi:MAG: zinc-binding dehydrogenase [Bacteroidota bacterium]